LVDSKHYLRPIKPFLSHLFLDYLSHLLSTPDIETQMDHTCDEALAWKRQGSAEFVDNMFHGTLIQEFIGPDGNLFIDQGKDKKMRLLFGFSLDFFLPRGSRKRSSLASIGVLTVYCLNLPLAIRQKPENLCQHYPRPQGAPQRALEPISPTYGRYWGYWVGTQHPPFKNWA
jgi:hypothetical protein